MPPFKILIVPVTPFQQNCAVIVCDETNRGAVLDPGGDLPRIEAAIAQSGAKIDKIIITHGHFDHIGAVAELARKLGLKIEGPHRDDKQFLDNLPEIAAAYGFPKTEAFTPDRWLQEGDYVTIGAQTFDILHCPGHSPGSVVFVWRKPEQHAEESGFAIMGDVLFNGSIGRTDLPGGNHETLIRMIKTKILPLDDNTAFICGHGPASAIGHERKSNPFLT